MLMTDEEYADYADIMEGRAEEIIETNKTMHVLVALPMLKKLMTDTLLMSRNSTVVS